MTVGDIGQSEDAKSIDARAIVDPESPRRLWVPADGGVSADEEAAISATVSRRTALRIGAIGAAGVAIGAGRLLAEPALAQQGLLSGNGVLAAAATAVADVVYIEAFPTSPLILHPFTDDLTIPQAMRPTSSAEYSSWAQPPGPGDGQQNGGVGLSSNGTGNERHQIWTSQLGYPDPIVYKINHQVSTHSFTTSDVLPIDAKGQPTGSFDSSGNPVPAGLRQLPASTIYGFNGKFPWGRGSTPSTANRSSSGSRTTWTRTPWAWTGRTSAPPTTPR